MLRVFRGCEVNWLLYAGVPFVRRGKAGDVTHARKILTTLLTAVLNQTHKTYSCHINSCLIFNFFFRTGNG